MKQLTSYNRVAGYLNKVFDLLNAEYFESALTRPTITIQSTPRAYGHFTLNDNTWISTLGGSHEINIGAGTLARPIEEICATLLHEMVHYYNFVNGIQDCSRGNTYHNKRFKQAAEQRGLTVEHSEKYGWSHTAPTEELLDFVIENGLTDILINLKYNPMRICRCFPEFTVRTEFGEPYGVNLSQGYARCDDGQADLTAEQIEEIQKILENQT